MTRKPTTPDLEAARELIRDHDRADTRLSVRCSRARLRDYNAAAKRAGLTLSAWVIGALDEALHGAGNK